MAAPVGSGLVLLCCDGTADTIALREGGDDARPIALAVSARAEPSTNPPSEHELEA